MPDVDLRQAARRSLLVIYIAALTGVVLTMRLDRRAGYLQDFGLAIPSPAAPRAACALLLGFTVVLVLRYGHLGPRAGRALAWLGTGASIALSLTSTPFTSGEAHLYTAVANLVALTALAVYLIADPGRAQSRVGRVAQGPITTGLTLTFLFLAGEAVFSSIPSSHAVPYTLSAKLWKERYWKPWNPDGYRDLDRRGMKGRPIFVLGDSFIAGAGIANIEDRISNLLHRRLRPAYKVYNLGRPGSDTRDEYQRLLQQTEVPAAIILQYYNNDIGPVCTDAGITVPSWEPYADLPTAVRAVVQRSYFLDFLYWRVPHGDLRGFESALEKCYTEPPILAAHLGDLERFVSYAQDRRVSLVVVAFPHLVDADRTRKLIDPVVQYFKDQHIPVVDVYPILASLRVGDRIVNRNDAHPSVLLNRLVADALAPALTRRGIDSRPPRASRAP